MSLDVTLTAVRPTEVFEYNITHNLGVMAEEAGIYKHLWRPEEINITHAEQLIGPLGEALVKLKANPKHFEKFNPPNGWGSYESLVLFVERYWEACVENPDAIIGVSR